MEKQGRLLIVDDDEDILTAGKLLLKRYFETIVTLNTPDLILETLKKEAFDVIFLDMNFGPGESSGGQGLYWLQEILKRDPDVVVVMITAHAGMNLAIEAMKLGATDFIAKPWQNEKVIATLSTCCKLGQSRSEAKRLKQNNDLLVDLIRDRGQPIIGGSPRTRQMLEMIERAGPTEANVLILGENGTGKELAARAVHAASLRSDRVFVSVDLGSVSETLFESELFGHKKGAFTGAHTNKTGRLVAADGGTLFLDEIGNLPLHLQVKLLTVLEQRQVTPIGTNDVVPIDVRVIAATNLPKEKLYNEQFFRQDLLFRLNTVEIEVPALRERREDIDALARYYAGFYARKYGKGEKVFADGTLTLLGQYNWPGNIRALRHAMERAVILSVGEAFEPHDFALSSISPAKEEKTASVHSDLVNSGPVHSDLVNSDPVYPSPVETSLDEDMNLERLEKRTVTLALRKHKYNISHAAKELGLTRAALYRRMEKYGL